MPTTLPGQLTGQASANNPYAAYVGGQTPSGAITSDTLAQTPTLNYKSPEQVPIYPAATLNPAPQTDPNALGAEGTKAQSLTDLIQGLNTQDTGQADYRAGQEKALGVQALTNTQNDLTSRLTALKNEAMAIPLQLQNNVEGRGVTAAGLQPLQTAALRNNAIQSLSVNSLLEASRGNLTTALDMVDRAVKQKFDPIEEQISAATANLNLILKSPAYTNEEKQRAQAQLDIQTAKKDALDKQKQDAKDIYGLATSAASNGADPMTLHRISTAKTPDEALAILSQSGFARDPMKDAQAQADLAQTKAQTAKLYADASAASGSSGVDPANLVAFAQEYASTGKIPTGLPKGTFGVVSQLAKEAPKPDGTIVNTSTGVVPSNINSAQVEGLSALRDLTLKLGDLEALYKNTSLLSSNPDRQRYKDLSGEVVDLLSRARSGAALTESEIATYTKKIPQLFSITNLFGANLPATGEQKITDLKSSLSNKLNTSLAAHGAVMYGFTKVNVGGQQYTVGQTVSNAQGQTGVINADGTITLIQ